MIYSPGPDKAFYSKSGTKGCLETFLPLAHRIYCAPSSRVNDQTVSLSLSSIAAGAPVQFRLRIARQRKCGGVDTICADIEAVTAAEAVGKAMAAMDAYIAGGAGVGVMICSLPAMIVWCRRVNMPAPISFFEEPRLDLPRPRVPLSRPSIGASLDQNGI